VGGKRVRRSHTGSHLLKEQIKTKKLSKERTKKDKARQETDVEFKRITSVSTK
jgi:hypothetical protein